MHDSGPTINTSQGPSPGGKAFLALIIGNICLAFGPWLVRLADVGPIASAFWRLTIAVPFLFLAMRMLGQRLPRMKAGLWAMMGVAGLFFAGDLAAWHLGILQTKLANATLFGNSPSLMFPIYGFLIARTWPNRGQAAALLLAAFGAALLMGQSYELSGTNLVGDLLCLLSGALYTGYFIAMSRARLIMGPLPALTLTTMAGVIPLLLFALAMGDAIWPQNWSALVLLALFSQVIGQGLMIYALGHFQPLVIGLALLIQPVVSGAIGWMAYDERLGTLDLIGALAVAIALVLVRRPDKSAASRLAAEPPSA